MSIQARPLSFADQVYQHNKKPTKLKRMLDEMEKVIPWDKIMAMIEPHYHRAGGRGRQPYPLETMLRIYLVKSFQNYSDPEMEGVLYENLSVRFFCRLSLGVDHVPDETTILNFRHLLEEQQLGEAIFEEINAILQEKGLLIKEGSVVDATIIHAPTSTKNSSGSRDPEMRSTKKGNQWYFGMKAHIGVDDSSPIVHSVHTTAANEHDVTQAHHLLHGGEKRVFADAGYQGVEKRPEHEGRDATWYIAMKPGKRRALGDSEDDIETKAVERLKSKLRAHVEHPFRVIKEQFSYRKVRYKGLAKNTNHLYMLFALSNLYLCRRQLAN